MQAQPLRSVDPAKAIQVALSAVQRSPTELQQALESIPAPIYLTDTEGWVTFFNSACINFAGRTPVAGQDRWCVTWRLMTEQGKQLPHDLCPMALAIKERREVSGVVAIAERPDGTSLLFTPHPKLIYSEDGTFTGAVNLLIDITEQRQVAALLDQAQRCRRLAAAVMDERTTRTLNELAEDYEAKARALRAVIS
jgi:PAS domain S-box-containing protein